MQIACSASDADDTVGECQSIDVNEAGAVGTDISTDALMALAEASRTTYVRGRWVLQDSNGELQYVIVAPSLPGEFQFPCTKSISFELILYVKRPNSMNDTFYLL